MSMPASVYLLSLGCAKNLVDSECMSQIIRAAGYPMVQRPEEADVMIVNTCGFIESAKKEAIGAILDLAAYKKPLGRASYLIVAGCLSQRYSREIRRDLPEVDAVLGTADYARIARVIDGLLGNDPAVRAHEPGEPGSLAHLAIDREVSASGRYAYIKIAEGCANCCAYCAIPGIRGPYRSRPLPELVAEADRLSRRGRDEIILIAQDTTRFGVDLSGSSMLVDLLKAICRLPAVRQVRLLYVYADSISDELIRCLAEEPKIAHYLDMPIQHAADSILRRMNRHDTQDGLRSIVGKLRAAMPDLVLRTTVLVGFPGETAGEFSELLAFLQEIRFDRLGCFIYSAEEGTAAYNMTPRVRPSVGRARQMAIMELQQTISAAANRARMGKVVDVVLESIDDRGIFFIGRSYGEAPEVDPVIYVAGTTDQLQVGQVCRVRLVEAGEYDMTGVTVE
jgi:ribosomal protein S12 methylthiotransferase